MNNFNLRNVAKGGKTSEKIPMDVYMIEKYLKHKKNGVFIEAGGFDGVFQSNTYVLEKYYNWSGIIVEPAFNQYVQCKKNRNVNIYNVALVPFDYNKDTICGDFEDGSPFSSINGVRSSSKQLIEVKAVTLQSILNQLNITKVDFFSLDVEGYELSVLKGIDFEKIKFEFILIEFNPTKIDELMAFMSERNYEFLENVSNYTKETNPHWDGLHNDYLFRYIHQ